MTDELIRVGLGDLLVPPGQVSDMDEGDGSGKVCVQACRNKNLQGRGKMTGRYVL